MQLHPHALTRQHFTQRYVARLPGATVDRRQAPLQSAGWTRLGRRIPDLHLILYLDDHQVPAHLHCAAVTLMRDAHHFFFVYPDGQPGQATKPPTEDRFTTNPDRAARI